MRVYWKLILLNLESQMQYKLSFLMTVIGQFVTSFVGVFGVSFMFGYMSEIGEFSYNEVLLCFAIVTLAFSIGETFGGGLAVFAGILGNGEFDRALVRPRNVLLQLLAPRVDFTRIGLLLQAVLVLIYALPLCHVAWNCQKIITICLMIICGSILFFALFLFKASFSFFTVQSLDFLNLFTYGAREFGKYPFSIYGKGILNILTYVIPLALFQYYPLLYLLDKRTEEYYMLFPVLSLLFLIPCYILFTFGVRRYKSTGS